MTDQYAIIGYPLTHSFSPSFFNAKFQKEGIDANYSAMPIAEIAEFPVLIAANPQLKGLNVTIPYKQSVIPFLDELDVAAAKIGAVNCIGIRGGKTKGYNTDVIGFERSLRPLLQPQHEYALILGTGGVAKAVAYVLQQKGISYKVVSRTAAPGLLVYNELTPEMILKFKFIINTTPLGMFPATSDCPPIPYEGIGSKHLVYDLIYNPEETKFLAHAKAQGALIKNGLEMLHTQALAGWDIWNEVR